jgi:hypothetical protein
MPVARQLPDSPGYLDNILLLLTNIISHFLKYHPKSNEEETATTSFEIISDLQNIKLRYGSFQKEMFRSFENYVVQFVEADIGKYRFELTRKIEELTALKLKLIEESKANHNRKCQADTNEISVLDGKTPIGGQSAGAPSPRVRRFKEEQW